MTHDLLAIAPPNPPHGLPRFDSGAAGSIHLTGG